MKNGTTQEETGTWTMTKLMVNGTIQNMIMSGIKITQTHLHQNISI